MRKQEIRTQPTDKVEKGLKAFPSGLPKPHAARDWGRSIQTAITERGLTDVARKELPPGLFDKLWSADALQEPPELPAGASFGDQLRWRSMRDEVEKRKAHNDLYRSINSLECVSCRECFSRAPECSSYLDVSPT